MDFNGEYTWQEDITQENIDQLPVPYNCQLKPGWHWVTAWPAFDPKTALIIFSPVDRPDEEVAIWLRNPEVEAWNVTDEFIHNITR